MLEQKNDVGLVRELNPGPLAPEARIIPLDQRATYLAVFANSTPDKTQSIRICDVILNPLVSYDFGE